MEAMCRIIINKQNIGGEEINSVNARNLHEALEVKTEFSHWIKRRLKDSMAIKDEDYIVLEVSSNLTTLSPKMTKAKKDYIITTDLAKEISMLEKTERGKLVRKHFIKAERDYTKALIANNPKGVEYKLPKTYSEALRALADSEEKKITLEAQHKRLFLSDETYPSTYLAKELGLSSANLLNEILHKVGIIFKQGDVWLPYAKYSHYGILSIKTGKDFKTTSNWTQRGRDFILKNWEKIKARYDEKNNQEIQEISKTLKA